MVAGCVEMLQVIARCAICTGVGQLGPCRSHRAKRKPRGRIVWPGQDQAFPGYHNRLGMDIVVNSRHIGGVGL